MRSKWTNRFALVVFGLLLASCSDEADSPAAVNGSAGAMNSMDAMHSVVPNGVVAATDPFTFRAPLDPYRINRLPDFLIRSKAKSDIVFQRSIFAPGAGMWHTHPGPSFVYVLEGQIKIERVVRRGKCNAGPVHGPGQAYVEEGEQVHRAVVVSAEPAVLLVTRFNVPVGGAFTIPAADPGC